MNLRPFPGSVLGHIRPDFTEGSELFQSGRYLIHAARFRAEPDSSQDAAGELNSGWFRETEIWGKSNREGESPLPIRGKNFHDVFVWVAPEGEPLVGKRHPFDDKARSGHTYSSCN